MAFTDPAEALQTAIVALLANAADVVSLVGDHVYDDVPKAREFPCVSFGPATVLPELAEAIDAADTTLQLDVWAREPGFVMAKRVGRAVVAALHDASTDTGAGAVQSFLLESARYVRDPDGITSHGILTFNILTDANA